MNATYMIKPPLCLSLICLFLTSGLRSQNEGNQTQIDVNDDFIINERKPLDGPPKLRRVYDVWTMLRVYYHEASVAYLYESNGLQLCVFDLNSEGRHIVFFSHPGMTEMILTVGGQKVKNKPAYIRHKFGDDQEIEKSILGATFVLEESQPCEMKCNVILNAGIADFALSRDGRGWWSGSVKLKIKDKPPLPNQ